MSIENGLRTLSARKSAQAPWGFEEFELRRSRAAQQRRLAVWSAALSVAALALVSTLALVTQPKSEIARLVPVSPAGAGQAAGMDDQMVPALVDMGHFDVTSALEDQIAMLDAELSAARVQQVPAAQLQPIESAREQLSASLQRVSYAHALLNL